MPLSHKIVNFCNFVHIQLHIFKRILSLEKSAFALRCSSIRMEVRRDWLLRICILIAQINTRYFHVEKQPGSGKHPSILMKYYFVKIK